MELDPEQHSPETVAPPPAPERPKRLTFAEEVAALARGTVNDEATAALYELVEAVTHLEKPGKLTLTIAVEPAGSGRRSVVIAGEVAVKAPKPAPELTFRYVGDAGSLHLDDPYAARIPGVPFLDADGDVRVVDTISGDVRRVPVEPTTEPRRIEE
jgi:hypothetical protein